MTRIALEASYVHPTVGEESPRITKGTWLLLDLNQVTLRGEPVEEGVRLTIYGPSYEGDFTDDVDKPVVANEDFDKLVSLYRDIAIVQTT